MADLIYDKLENFCSWPLFTWIIILLTLTNKYQQHKRKHIRQKMARLIIELDTNKGCSRRYASLSTTDYSLHQSVISNGEQRMQAQCL